MPVGSLIQHAANKTRKRDVPASYSDAIIRAGHPDRTPSPISGDRSAFGAFGDLGRDLAGAGQVLRGQDPAAGVLAPPWCTTTRQTQQIAG